jgi:hypothetical protein
VTGGPDSAGRQFRNASPTERYEFIMPKRLILILTVGCCAACDDETAPDQ